MSGWIILGRDQYTKLALGTSLSRRELSAVAGLVPLLVQTDYRSARFNVACLNAEDKQLATLLVACLRSYKIYQHVRVSKKAIAAEWAKFDKEVADAAE